MNRMDGWGVTGWSNEWTALGSDGPDEGGPTLDGYGVRRTVDPGVVYASPPDVPNVARWHQKPRGKGRVFEMEWREDFQPATRSVLDIQEGLASRRRSLAADDPDLALLDAAFDGFLAAASGLHARGASLGFVQPDSCRVGTLRDGKPFVVLPDVGFAWDKRSGLMLPRWIDEPNLEQLFDDGAERRNEDYLAEISRGDEARDIRQRAAEDAARELADVKIVARLAAAALVGPDEIRRWCGAGKRLPALPSKDVARDTQGDIWDKVIAPALAGQVLTCEELRARLGVYKPSSHYLHVPPTPPWVGWAVLRRVTIVAAAVGLLAAMSLLGEPLTRWFMGTPAPFCRVVPRTDPLYARLVELRDAHNAARGDVAARPAFWNLLHECRTEHAALQACSRDCLGGLVDDWLAQAEEEGRATHERLRSRPRPTSDEVAELTAAIAAIRRAEAEAKRPQSSSVMGMLDRELRLRGGPPTVPNATKPSRTK